MSQGIYHYANLPILTEKVENIKGDETFENHFSIVAFLGENIDNSKTSLFNLNEVIYKTYYKSLYFQIVIIVPKGTENQIINLKKKLATYNDASKWKFVFASKEQIVTIFNSFDTPYKLNDNYASDYCFIVDRELRLRGRKDDEDTLDGKLYGYNMNSVADLRNKMKDDIGIIYYQLKKSLEKEQRRKI